MEKEIEKRLIRMMSKQFWLSAETIEKNREQMLTSSIFKFDALRMFELMICIEREFDIVFLPEDFQEISFRRFDDIVHAIEWRNSH